MDQYDAVTAYNEYLIKTAMDFWTAMAFPALYLARNL